MLNESYDLYSNMGLLAIKLYDQMQAESPQKALLAQRALRNVSPSEYDQLQIRDRQYWAVISFYELSSEPVGRDKLRALMLETLQNSLITRKIPPE